MPRDEEFEVDEPEIRAMLNDIGHTIGDQLPAGWGMTLLIFSFGDGGATFYISNAERGTMIAALQEFVRHQKQRGH
jgi:hypothetical protein